MSRKLRRLEQPWLKKKYQLKDLRLHQKVVVNRFIDATFSILLIMLVLLVVAIPVITAFIIIRALLQ